MEKTKSPVTLCKESFIGLSDPRFDGKGVFRDGIEKALQREKDGNPSRLTPVAYEVLCDLASLQREAPPKQSLTPSDISKMLGKGWCIPVPVAA